MMYHISKYVEKKSSMLLYIVITSDTLSVQSFAVSFLYRCNLDQL